MSEKNKVSRIGLLWVAAQFILIGGWIYLVLEQLETLINRITDPDLLSLAALALILIGIVMEVLSVLHLGANFTPLPEPKSSGNLIQSGIYSKVRHPIYGGILLMIWGGTLLLLSGNQYIGILLGAIIITLFFCGKSIYEEGRLVHRFPEYRTYRKRTGRFLPRLFSSS